MLTLCLIKLKLLVLNSRSLKNFSTYILHVYHLVYLREVTELSGVLDVPEDFLTPEFRAECEHIPDRENIEPNECKDVFHYLKDNFRL